MHLASTLIDTDLTEYSRQVLTDLAMREAEVESKNGHSYIMRVRPYRTITNTIDGVVITFDDISERKLAEEMTLAARAYAESIIATVREPLVILDEDLRVTSANQSFYRNFQMTPEDTEGKRVYELRNRKWCTPGLRERLEDILPKKTTLEDYEVEYKSGTTGQRTMLCNARRLEQKLGEKQLILLAIEDVTEYKQRERACGEPEQ